MPKMILDIWHGERGIDLSKWKSKFGLWGVIVKCGGSDDPELGRFEETTWVEQVTQAHALGLHVGAYYYSDATDAATALADARHCVHECMRGMTVDMPVYLDVEERSQLDLPMWQLTEVVTTFCDYVRGAGYQVGIYSGYEGFHNMFEDEIASYSLWVAAWRTSWPIWAKDYDLWQEGSIDYNGTKYHENWNVDQAGHVDLDWASDAFVARIEGGSVARKTIDPAEEAAEIHAFMCTDPRFGYSQEPRWGGDYNGGEVATFTSKAGYEYKIPCGGYDCSSSSTLSWRLALSRTPYAGALGDDPNERTATMRGTFCGTGLFMAKYSPARRGDLYLNEGVHVAMCQDGDPNHDILSEFVRDERGRASGGIPGDQDGGESVIRGYYDDKWNTVLHYVGGLLEDVTAPEGEEDERGEGDMVPKMGFYAFDSDPTEHFFDGQHLHAIASPDEKRAIMDFYATAGVRLDPNPTPFGTDSAPWGARLNDALSRGAEFRGFERFVKHPSTKKVLQGIVTEAVKTLTDNVRAMLKDGR